MYRASNNAFAFGVLCALLSGIAYVLGAREWSGAIAILSIALFAGSLIMFLIERIERPKK